MSDEEREMGNVLVVGGAGYVGGYLVDYFLEMGCDVTVFDNLMYESRYLKDVPFIRGDVRDRKLLRQILHEYDTVIWLAAIVGDGACAVDPFLTQEINSTMPKWLVDNFAGKIVYPSTCSVYGVNNEKIGETAEPNPLSIYAETKLEAEQYIVANANDYLLFRLGTLYGLGDALSRIRLDLVVNILTQRAAQGLKLTVNGGEQWRPLLHVRDVATAMYYGLSMGLTGLFNLASENCTIKQIAETIKCQLVDVEVQYMDMTFEDQRNYRVHTDLWTNYGWEPQHTLKEGIREITEVICQGRIKNVGDSIYSNAGFINEHYWRM